MPGVLAPTIRGSIAGDPPLSQCLGSRMAPVLTAARKVERDKRIVVDRARGMTWRTIAASHGLSERQCRQVYFDQRQGSLDLDEFDSGDALVEVLDQLEALIEDLAHLAVTASHDAVRLGALNSKRRAIAERFEILQACGFVPINLLDARTELDVRRATRDMIEQLEKHDVPMAAIADIVEAWQGRPARAG
jgi:hypothetical protein